ncbi:MAG: NAD(P)H-dependent oxidoreductase subunit E [Candidatus Zixiibacteriota bacterium]|nr:MAG: NAD(P)H-dependent oxidoreductase subunit E [candidate division Zixibacteria bacterium]
MNPVNSDGSLKKLAEERDSLIAILENIQAKYGYLPEDALREVATETGRSLVDIYGVATFYRAFSLKPRGRHLVSACLGTACHVRGGPVIAKEIGKQLDIKPGQTASDNEFTFETVNCLGACALGPVVVVDGHYFPNMKTSIVKQILEKSKLGLEAIEIDTDQRVFPVEVSCSRCNHSLMDSGHLIDGHPSIRITISFGNVHGWLALSSLYGSYNVSSEYEIPPDIIVNFFCPHCHAELLGASKCGECGAPMVPMIVRGGGVVQICSRRGCKGHMLDLDGVNV